MVLSSHTQHLG